MAWFKCGGGGGGIPAILKSLMNSVFNKKFGTAEIYPPETWPDTVNLMGPLEEKTVSGSVVTFSDGADAVKLKSCAVTIAPTLDGVSSVDVVHGGKNVFDITTYPITEKRYIRSSDGYFAISTRDLRGATEDYIPCVSMRGKTWVINKPNQTGNTLGLAFYDENKDFLSSVLTWPSGTNGVFTVPNNAFYFRFSVDLSSEDDTEIQIEAGTTTTAYTPYVTPTTHTANLGRTIYGGSVDVVNGTGAETSKKIAFSALTWTYDSTYSRFLSSAVSGIKIQSGRTLPMVCDNYTVIDDGRPLSNVPDMSIYNSGNSGGFYVHDARYTTVEDFLQNMGNTIVCYPIATPETFTFTPVSINSRLGDNTIWGDGDLSVVYRSSGTQTIIQPTLISKTITENGTYSASDEGADGYDEVTVNVPTGTTEPFKVLSINGTAGSETFTADKAGTYMFLVGTSAQGSESITSSVTPDLTFSKQSSDNRGLIGAIYTLAVGDTVTMTNSVVSWVYNTKVVVEMNITVSSVIDSTIVNDGTITSFSPSVTGNALFISMAGGRSADNSYDRTYTDLNSFEFFGKVETGIFLRIRYGSTVPSYQLYGYDGGCALAIALSVNAPSLLMGDLGNPGPVNEPEQDEPDAAPENPEEIQEETPEEVDQNESDE